MRGIGVIQGDGINIHTLAQIADAVTKAGFSAQNVAYGMGGGLLQKVHRDTMSFATKLSMIIYEDGIERNVMKMPKGDRGKRSLPGEFLVCREDNVPKVYPAELGPMPNNELKVVYDNGKVCSWDDFSTIKERVKTQWNLCPIKTDPISSELSLKIEKVEAAQSTLNAMS